MATASINQRIQEVTDPSSRRALEALFGAVKSELAELKEDSIINATTLSKGSTPENVANTAFQFRIDGVTYAKAAVSAGTALGITDTINNAGATGIFYGGFVVMIVGAGTVTFKAAAADQVFTTAAAAEAAARAIATTAGTVTVGWFVVGSKADTKWTAGTDDLDGDGSSDSSYVAYYSAPAAHFLTE
jgi:hypothetical protein